MDIVCYEARDLKKTSGRVSGIRSLREFNEKLQITTSHAIEDSVPGKSLKWMVVEKNTNTIIGFCRFGSPTINSKPRNDWLGTTPDLSIFNRHAIMGFIIVPTQPFGYNYLGGKLLAMLCCTHEVREILNKNKVNIGREDPIDVLRKMYGEDGLEAVDAVSDSLLEAQTYGEINTILKNNKLFDLVPKKTYGYDESIVTAEKLRKAKEQEAKNRQILEEFDPKDRTENADGGLIDILKL